MSDINWACQDCKLSTFTEYYMVQNKLWHQACPTDAECLLCIECLEKRINRQLKKGDFTDCPLNEGTMGWDTDTKSPLLQKRLKGL